MRVFNPEVFNESIRRCAENVYSDSLIIKGDDLEYEVRKALLETKRPKGVYFLISGSGKLLYVGKSENILERLVSHINGKGGNSSRYISFVKEIRIALFSDCTGKSLHTLEKTFITSLKPAFNGGNYSAGSTAQYGYESLYHKLNRSITEDDLVEMLTDWPKIGDVS
jgi:predicted GIY-YIG superfamily endonuclease